MISQATRTVLQSDLHPRILLALRDGPLNYEALKDETEITRSLWSYIRTLKRNNLVESTRHPELSGVHYRLTEEGHRIAEWYDEWSRDNRAGRVDA